MLQWAKTCVDEEFDAFKKWRDEMRYQIYVLLVLFLLVWPTSDGFAQTDVDYFSRDEIPAADAGTVDAYYDPLTGDVLLSIGEEIGILVFGVPTVLENDDVSVNLRASFDAIDRDALREDAIPGASFFDESPDGLGWTSPSTVPPSLPTGVFNVGPIYDALPIEGLLVLNSPLLTIDTSDPENFFAELAQRSPEERFAIELALVQYYRTTPTGFSLVSNAFGVPAEVTPVRFLRPEFETATIPEPCPSVLFSIAGAGLLMRRRR